MTAGRSGRDLGAIHTGQWSAACQHRSCGWMLHASELRGKPAIRENARAHARVHRHTVGMSAEVRQVVFPPAGLDLGGGAGR